MGIIRLRRRVEGPQQSPDLSELDQVNGLSRSQPARQRRPERLAVQDRIRLGPDRRRANDANSLYLGCVEQVTERADDIGYAAGFPTPIQLREDAPPPRPAVFEQVTLPRAVPDGPYATRTGSAA